jgi:hypothetical protein
LSIGAELLLDDVKRPFSDEFSVKLYLKVVYPWPSKDTIEQTKEEVQEVEWPRECNRLGR